MCRLLGILAERSLRLATYLPPELTPPTGVDGWGAAVRETGGVWALLEAEASERDRAFALVDRAPQGDTLIALARQRAAHGIDAQPLRSGRWVFAHDGIVDDMSFLRDRTAPQRRSTREPSGGEQLFAFLLTRIDEASSSPDGVDAALVAATSELASRPMGSLTFLLSDGDTLYAHRLGPPLWVASLYARAGMPPAVLVASQPITQDPYEPIDDRTLLRCRRAAAPRALSGPGAPASDIELPFTD